MLVEIRGEAHRIELERDLGVILVEPHRIGVDLPGNAAQGTGKLALGDFLAVAQDDGAMRRALAVEQRQTEFAREGVHVGMVGVDELPARLDRRLAGFARGVHAPAKPRPRLVELRVDSGLCQVPERGQPGDPSADNRHRAAARRGEGGTWQRRRRASRAQRQQHRTPRLAGIARHRRGDARLAQIGLSRRLERMPDRLATPHSRLLLAVS